ncbi:hypothetical protein NFI96_008634 [Prochilodus magdalenae]|nr:hypothetical protein NFI96_008634 [Prochilodus magdalenae]
MSTLPEQAPLQDDHSSRMSTPPGRSLLQNEQPSRMSTPPERAHLQNALRPSAAETSCGMISRTLKALWSQGGDFSTAGQKLYTCSLKLGLQTKLPPTQPPGLSPRAAPSAAPRAAPSAAMAEHLAVNATRLLWKSASLESGQETQRLIVSSSEVRGCAHNTMLKHLQAMDASRSFSEFRQEASMLHTLQHPCIVALMGISIHPLCFALELAPLGSLNTVLEERSKGSQFMPLGHMLTFKAAYQIATGLAYLHKKNIIFCDLKSDNILVWSLEVEDPVNIKLSDYGISRLSFHEGALGVEGTPGYQAPEIRPGIVYDEKISPSAYETVTCRLECRGT